MQGVVSGMGGVALVYESVCVWVVGVSDGDGVSRISGRVAARSKSVKSFDEHQSNNVTATHSSIVHSQPHYRHSPCCSVEVATKDAARSLTLTEKRDLS